MPPPPSAPVPLPGEPEALTTQVGLGRPAQGIRSEVFQALTVADQG